MAHPSIYGQNFLFLFYRERVAEKISGNRFVVKSDKPNVEISWQVTGVRHDAYANAHPMVVEQEKVGVEKGKYMHPELFGKSAAEYGLPVAASRNHSVANKPFKSTADLAAEKAAAEKAIKQKAANPAKGNKTK